MERGQALVSFFLARVSMGILASGRRWPFSRTIPFVGIAIVDYSCQAMV